MSTHLFWKCYTYFDSRYLTAHFPYSLLGRSTFFYCSSLYLRTINANVTEYMSFSRIISTFFPQIIMFILKLILASFTFLTVSSTPGGNLAFNWKLQLYINCIAKESCFHTLLSSAYLLGCWRVNLFSDQTFDLIINITSRESGFLCFQRCRVPAHLIHIASVHLKNC